MLVAWAPQLVLAAQKAALRIKPASLPMVLLPTALHLPHIAGWLAAAALMLPWLRSIPHQMQLNGGAAAAVSAPCRTHMRW